MDCFGPCPKPKGPTCLQKKIMNRNEMTRTSAKNRRIAVAPEVATCHSRICAPRWKVRNQLSAGSRICNQNSTKTITTTTTRRRRKIRRKRRRKRRRRKRRNKTKETTTSKRRKRENTHIPVYQQNLPTSIDL